MVNVSKASMLLLHEEEKKRKGLQNTGKMERWNFLECPVEIIGTIIKKEEATFQFFCQKSSCFMFFSSCLLDLQNVCAFFLKKGYKAVAAKCGFCSFF